jgi:large subunit ribosomal protein L4
VAGGGAKPFKQKGTGRARQGSIRAPQWSGGGIALGPKPRSYRQRTPKKMVRLALLSALSDRAALSRVVVIDNWDYEVPKTKEAVQSLKALGVDGKVLVVLGPMDGVADRSFGNLPEIQTVQIAEINAYDVLRNDWVVFTDETLPGETTTVPGSAEAVLKAAQQAEDEAAAVQSETSGRAAKKARGPKKAAVKKAAAKKAEDDVASDDDADTEVDADEVETDEVDEDEVETDEVDSPSSELDDADTDEADAEDEGTES